MTRSEPHWGGAELWMGDEGEMLLATVRRIKGGYYWYSNSDYVDRMNTAHLSPYPDIEEAKSACLAYVKEHLQR